MCICKIKWKQLRIVFFLSFLFHKNTWYNHLHMVTTKHGKGFLFKLYEEVVITSILFSLIWKHTNLRNKKKKNTKDMYLTICNYTCQIRKSSQNNKWETCTILFIYIKHKMLMKISNFWQNDYKSMGRTSFILPVQNNNTIIIKLYIGYIINYIPQSNWQYYLLSFVLIWQNIFLPGLVICQNNFWNTNYYIKKLNLTNVFKKKKKLPVNAILYYSKSAQNIKRYKIIDIFYCFYFNKMSSIKGQQLKKVIILFLSCNSEQNYSSIWSMMHQHHANRKISLLNNYGHASVNPFKLYWELLSHFEV